MRDRLLVVCEVLVVTVLDRFVNCFEFYEYQRQSVDEADEIGAFVTQITSDPELTGQEEVVRLEEFPRPRT